jgi:hypothetical protein
LWLELRNPRKENLGPIIAKALEDAFGAKSLWAEFPDINDYTDKGIQRRRVQALEKIIKRERKLDAEQMLKIFLLKGDGNSSREIAREFCCSHTAVLVALRKVENVFRDENLL